MKFNTNILLLLLLLLFPMHSVIVDATLLNPNCLTKWGAVLECLTSFRIFFEVAVSGAVVPDIRGIAYRLPLFETSYDAGFRTLEICVLLMSMWLFIRELRHMYTLKMLALWKYVTAISTVLHLFSLALFFPCYCFYGLALAYNHRPIDVELDSNTYYDYNTPLHYYLVYRRLIAINCFFVFARLMRYLCFIPRVATILFTLHKSAVALSGWLLCFFLMVAAFSCSFTLAFGRDTSDYRDPLTAAFTLFRGLLGDVDFDALLRSDNTLGPLAFILNMLVMIFMLMNLFIGIVTDAYIEMRESLQNSTDDIEMIMLGKEIGRHLLEDLLFAIPFLGPLFQKAYEAWSEHLAKIQPKELKLRAPMNVLAKGMQSTRKLILEGPPVGQSTTNLIRRVSGCTVPGAEAKKNSPSRNGALQKVTRKRRKKRVISVVSASDTHV